MKQLTINLTENAHPHAEMITAKAADMSLVAFVNMKGDWGWVRTNNPIWDSGLDYFLCLPKHKEACLHWLNGGELQINRKGHGFLDWDRPSREWKVEVSFMFDINEFRIKPKKEKRWIALKWDNYYVLPRHYSTKKDAESSAANSMMGEFQYAEIEIEVTQ